MQGRNGRSPIPETTYGDNGSGDVLGVGVLGCGFQGRRRAAAAAATRGLRLTAVADAAPETAIGVAQRLGYHVRATDWETMLGDPNIHLVVIATPHTDHERALWQALEAGKHVLCEKPLTTAPEPARALALSADRRKRKLATGFNHRFYPPVRDAIRMKEAGVIGTMTSARITIGHKADPAFLASWHGDAMRSGGGTLMDNGVHAIDLARIMAGEIRAVKSYLVTAEETGLPASCEIEAFGLLHNGDRTMIELRSSWRLEQGYLTIEMRGDQGTLIVETAPWKLTLIRNGRTRTKRYVMDRVYDRLTEQFRSCECSLIEELESIVASCRQPLDAWDARVRHATGWDGCRATEIADALYRSARTGAEIVLKPLPIVAPAGKVLEREPA